MSDLQRRIWAVLSSGEMSGEDVARCFTDYFGNYLLDEGFAQHLVSEGFCNSADVGLDEDE